ncbi:MAG: DoxX family protein [Devosia sp.]|nr:DoxX family protein [Devosia sp.]
MSEPVAAKPPLTAGLRDAFVAFRAIVGKVPLSLVQLAMRISIGFVFFNSGLLKLRSFEFAVKLFQDEYRLPLLDPVLAAQLAMTVEIVLPLFLFVGLATRLATLPLLGMVAVIEIFVYPQAWVEHLLWASTLVVLLTRGPGVFSIDHLVDRHLKRTSGK